jgi:TP901 family phage tail tape measure protein
MNIGKVASVANMLKVPLSEVNAVIAQTTAGGVKAEVAFTGLKTAMLKMASPEGLKKMEKYGLNISATTIKSEGLLKTLQKMQGVDDKVLIDIFGQEAIQVISPLINDMEKFEKLIKRQNKAQNVAANAAFKASDTLQGSVTRLGTAFTNLFADNSELGELLKITILGVAGTLEAFGAALKLIGMALKGAWSFATSFAKSIGLIKENAEGAAGPIQRLTQWWFTKKFN